MDLGDAHDVEEFQQMRDRLNKIETASSPAKVDMSPDLVSRFEALEAKLASPAPSVVNSLDGCSTPGVTWADRLRACPSPGGFSLPNPFSSPGASSAGGGRDPSDPFHGLAGGQAATGFNRAIDPGIFKLSMSNPWAKSECQKQAQKILEDAGINAGFAVEGLQPAKSYSVRIEGSASAAARSVRQVLDNQRLENSLWRKYYGASLDKDDDGTHKPNFCSSIPTRTQSKSSQRWLHVNWHAQ